MISTKKMLALLCANIFFIALDRVLKNIALGFDPLYASDALFSFVFVKNYNIAFSIPIGGPLLNWAILAIVLLLLYQVFEFYKKDKSREFFFLLLVIFGAISNLFDRLEFGHVIDYLSVRYFTVFNVADVMIVAGVVFFIIFSKAWRLK